MSSQKRAIILILVCVFLLGGLFNRELVMAIETVGMKIAASAERAYAYGSWPFDARDTRLYDIDRAEYFFLRALSFDSNYPNAQHQLSRVSFLRGDLARALARIDIELTNVAAVPNSHYIRGLILGYMGRYEEAAHDYEIFLKSAPNNWAAVNDYAWVLLKANRPDEALVAIEKVLPLWEENPWLLNSYATALFETGRYTEALEAAQKANRYVQEVTEREWLTAYPGNDPKIAQMGVESFREAVADNMHSIEAALANQRVQ